MVTTRSLELDETAPRTAEGPALVAILTVPTPEPTAKLVAPPATVQVPPVSAAPHPLATVRPNESAARAAGAVTVTDFVALSVAPLSSVTVSFTVYVPADPYVWLGLTPLTGAEESPKSHAYDATVPSTSADADASNATARSVAVAVNDAVGGLFPAGTPRWQYGGTVEAERTAG